MNRAQSCGTMVGLLLQMVPTAAIGITGQLWAWERWCLLFMFTVWALTVLHKAVRS